MREARCRGLRHETRRLPRASPYWGRDRLADSGGGEGAKNHGKCPVRKKRRRGVGLQSIGDKK